MDQQKNEAQLLAAMAAAPTLEEQRRLASQLEAQRAEAKHRAEAERAYDWAGEFLSERMASVETYDPRSHTAGTDWLNDVEIPDGDPAVAENTMRAEASVWHASRHPEVLDDPRELLVQAHALASRRASQFGVHASKAREAFLEQVRHLAGITTGAWGDDEAPENPDPPQPGHDEYGGTGSSLPKTPEAPETHDTGFPPESDPDETETSASDTPSLNEGDEPEDDQAVSADGEAPHASDTNNDAASWDRYDGDSTVASRKTAISGGDTVVLTRDDEDPDAGVVIPEGTELVVDQVTATDGEDWIYATYDGQDVVIDPDAVRVASRKRASRKTAAADWGLYNGTTINGYWVTVALGVGGNGDEWYYDIWPSFSGSDEDNKVVGPVWSGDEKSTKKAAEAAASALPPGPSTQDENTGAFNGLLGFNATASRKAAAQFSSYEELEKHVRGLMAQHPDLVAAAEAAYGRQDQSWFDAQDTATLKILWEIAASSFFVSWDDEVYDALADRPGGFDAVASRRKTAEEGQTCSVCGDKIAKDPEGGGGYHHDNGEKHDHEAKPSGDAKESSRKTAISLTNIGVESDTVGTGTDPSGKRVRFSITPAEAKQLKDILFSDLAINFSGVDVEESDIIREGGRKTALSGCYCAHNADGSVTTMLCPVHASEDPCWTYSRVTGKRRKGSIVRGVCTNCGWAAKTASRKTAAVGAELTGSGLRGMKVGDSVVLIGHPGVPDGETVTFTDVNRNLGEGFWDFVSESGVKGHLTPRALDEGWGVLTVYRVSSRRRRSATWEANGRMFSDECMENGVGCDGWTDEGPCHCGCHSTDDDLQTDGDVIEWHADDPNGYTREIGSKISSRKTASHYQPYADGFGVFHVTLPHPNDEEALSLINEALGERGYGSVESVDGTDNGDGTWTYVESGEDEGDVLWRDDMLQYTHGSRRKTSSDGWERYTDDDALYHVWDKRHGPWNLEVKQNGPDDFIWVQVDDRGYYTGNTGSASSLEEAQAAAEASVDHVASRKTAEAAKVKCQRTDCDNDATYRGTGGKPSDAYSWGKGQEMFYCDQHAPIGGVRSSSGFPKQSRRHRTAGSGARPGDAVKYLKGGPKGTALVPGVVAEVVETSGVGYLVMTNGDRIQNHSDFVLREAGRKTASGIDLSLFSTEELQQWSADLLDQIQGRAPMPGASSTSRANEERQRIVEELQARTASRHEAARKLKCGRCGHEWTSRAQYQIKCSQCGAEESITEVTGSRKAVVASSIWDD